MTLKTTFIAGILALLSLSSISQEDRGYKVYQFPANMIPKIDGNTGDWDTFPKEYIVGTDQLWDDSGKYPETDPKNLDVKVKVAWVKGPWPGAVNPGLKSFLIQILPILIILNRANQANLSPNSGSHLSIMPGPRDQ